MKRMLFNATQQEELRVAIVDGQRLIDIDIESAGREQRKSNIYKGVITRIEPSLEACFVSYGEERHGFLPFKEVARSYFREGVDVRNASIKDALREGQEIMVQVEKEERGNKGAALTSFISLAGRYLVLMPNNPRGGGVSRRVEGEERQELREAMDKLDLPNGMSVIARTAGIGRNVDELQWDLNYLMQLWRAIEGAGKAATGAFLIYQESSLVIRAIRDYYQPDIGEILIDTDEIYEQAHQFMSHVMPDMVQRVKRYSDDVPLFSRFQIEHQIETAYARTVPLPSGGAIVIDHTEALVSVDVNSARATRGSDIETTALHTNLEAADEVARQLRLRDLGGLIVIDFIDMEVAKNQREVETRLKDALHHDRARVQMGKISRFGLMELSRQRLRPSLSEGSHVTCPRCSGTGHIRDTESSALQVLRIIQEEAMKENSASIHVQVPVDVAAFLLNEKRGEVLKIESRHRITIILIPNKHLETPHYKLERIKHDDPRLEDSQASYAMAEQAETDIGYSQRKKEEAKPRQEAVVKTITPEQPAPMVERKAADMPLPPPPPQQPVLTAPRPSFFARIAGWFGKKPEPEITPPVEETPQAAQPAPTNTGGERHDRNERNRHQRNRNRNRKDRDERDPNAPREAGSKEVARIVAADDSKPLNVPSEENRNDRGNRQQRPARPPREADVARENGKENREPREARDNREAQAGAPVREARPPRPPREPREAREDKRDEKRDDKREEKRDGEQEDLANRAALLSQDVLDESQVRQEGEENEQDGDEPRRRRRRGGRNRNRREREQSENLGHHVEDAQASLPMLNGEASAQPQAASLDKPSSPSLHSAPVAESQTATAIPQASSTPAHSTAVEAGLQALKPSSPIVASTIEPSLPTPAPVQEVVSTPSVDVPKQQELALAEPSVANMPSELASPVIAPATTVHPVTSEAIVQPVHLEASQAATQPSHLEATQAATQPIHSEATRAITQPIHLEATQAATQPIHLEATQAATQPIHLEATQAATQPIHLEATQAATQPIHLEATQAATQPIHLEATQAVDMVASEMTQPASLPNTQALATTGDLQQILESAGLVMASTDPEKLRAAQEAAATISPAPVRPPRQRKPAPVIVDEPLVQVDTKQ